ncbi:MAG: hypothetical protein PF572_02535 [Patescibacteria group bacterium]|jgi:hypothetical protein|nr:hypothetical protein [Patescibacteria group bacterium]
MFLHIKKGGNMLNEDRPETFNEMYENTWIKFLSIFKEFSFDDDDREFSTKIDMRSTFIQFSEKMYLEIQKTFNDEQRDVNKKKNKKILFLDNNQILLDMIPSFAFSEMQLLMVLTFARLSKEKEERVINTRALIIVVTKKYLNNIGASGDNMRITAFYDKGTYYLKIVNKSRIKKKLNKKKLRKDLEKLNVKIEISFL